MSIQDTLNQRHSTHGRFADNAKITLEIMALLKQGDKWAQLNQEQELALLMITHKLSRIVCGDPNFADNWHDVAGYATLIEETL